ncbi:hypothetical protein HMPREF9378_0532 [Streptococcus sanguinis SK1 = NCTC 7863]|uniref:Uncharacterized protein n=2 Tax=Streptococcus sanguinis TaxID=1305 RepID=F0IM67_STRSA|nr:hypothetical protein HMPREF9390_0532 [Streptococcus sanguinis SK405]EGC26450.1 hypothetical protein HMPREF9392_1353 [Streptococcus sanguinis SK678]EGD36337.1 hypothetical protein HMPREF9383_1219 [Streptococcus sanguinis SK150]EGF08455.1 hypothetical protein HMPREF9378_0532 [Streptococcus sanguinis SK1 = NCTC 7863]EGF21600.1 hypothetical protein HMPREF9395_1127 [Streptococcus sanguinis SK1058]
MENLLFDMIELFYMNLKILAIVLIRVQWNLMELGTVVQV